VRICLKSHAQLVHNPSVLRDLWNSFWALPRVWRRMTLAGIVFALYLTIFAWRVMIPLFGFAALVAFYLHFSRDRDSL